MFGQPYIISVLLSYSITCSFQFVWCQDNIKSSCGQCGRLYRGLPAGTPVSVFKYVRVCSDAEHFHVLSAWCDDETTSDREKCHTSQYCHAEGMRGCTNTTRVITAIQTDLHLPVKFHLTSRWFPRLVYAAERLSMCQFHACADFNHYTLCYSCVNHLIQHIKAFRVLLVKYDSLRLSPSLSSWVCSSLSSTATAVPLKTHQQLSGKMTMLIRSVCLCVC